MTEVLRVPYLGTAEDEVTVALWHVGEGDTFKKGECLLALETLKASFDVEAEADGVLLRRLAPEGRRLPVQGALAVWGEPGAQISDAELARVLQEASVAPGPAAVMQADEDDLEGAAVDTDSPAAVTTEQDTPAAPAARKRAKELGVDLAEVPGTGPNGLVRVVDVELFLKEAVKSGRIASNGELEPAFVRFLREEAEAFAALSSEFKLALYRKHGALIGDGAHFGRGAYIVAERLIAGDELFLGDEAHIDVLDFECGPMCAFQRGARVRVRRMRLGANAYFAQDVEIGGGGAMDPEAQLVIGSHGFVGEHVHLNPCRKIEIGDEVVISRNATLMTHSFGASALDGYPNRFAEVHVGDGCQVGIGCVLFPGTEMGAGSILLSGSSLVTSVGEGRLFGGVPAKDLKAARRELSEEERREIGEGLVQEFARQMVLRGHGMKTERHENGLRLTLRREGRHVIRFAEELPRGEGDLVVEDVRVGLQIADDAWEGLPIELTAIDLGRKRIRGPGGPLTDAFREFLRKRGTRLEPRTWSYRGGLL